MLKTSSCSAAGCPAQVVEGSAEGQIELSLAKEQLGAVLSWFQSSVLPADSSACLAFAPTQNKYQRAAVHKMVEAKFPQLETASSGVGDARALAVYGRGHAPQKVTSEEAGARAARLYAYACDAGLGASVSRDELCELMQSGSLTGELARVWEEGEARQGVMDAVLQAVKADDGGALRALAQAQPLVRALLQQGAKDALTGDLPLHAAARQGAVGALRALAELGADLEAANSQGKTALKVSRVFEQTDAEAVLLQLGAHDPEAHRFPLNSQAASLGLGLGLPPSAAPGPSPGSAARPPQGAEMGACQSPSTIQPPAGGGMQGAGTAAAASRSAVPTGAGALGKSQTGAYSTSSWMGLAAVAAIVAVGAVVVIRSRR